MKDVKELFEKAAQVRLRAYAPYSNFFVGSCLETDAGNLYEACNVENASYGLSVCAESNAIAKMVAAGEKIIKQLLVIVEGPGLSASCGACRQRIFEFSTPDTIIHLTDLHGNYKKMLIDEMLPFAFGPRDLAKTE